MMDKFSEIPYDIFSAILVLTDVECLFAMGQCNQKYRVWAGSTLLWKEIIRRMQECGVQLPAEGFVSIENMSFSQLKRSALRAFRFRRKWSSLEARPTQAAHIDCSPSRYAHSAFHTTQRLRWVIPINADFFAVKLGYHLSSGFLQIWRRNGNAPRIIVNWHSDWVGWGNCTDLDNKTWYFIYSEHSMNQHGHTLHLIKFTGFDSEPEKVLDMSIVAKYPTYGSLINVFFLDVHRRALCAAYSGSNTGTITIFFIPDWSQKQSIYFDTGVKEDYRTKRSIICSWDKGTDQLMFQFDSVSKEKICQHIYSLDNLEKLMLLEPALPYPLPHPEKLEPVQTYYIDYVDMPPDQNPSHELRSIVSFNHHYSPILPHASGTQAVPLCSNLIFASSFGRDLNPTYVLQHTYVGLAGKRPFLWRVATPTIKRMAFEQDYMDTNTTERFPLGHALDLRGHELVALGHSCVAWIEARGPASPIIVIRDYDQIEYELKLVLFSWSMEEGGKTGMPRMFGDRDSGLTVCTVICPPEVDLAKVTGLWLDAVQGRIFLGMKWGKFIVLQFD